MAEQATMASPPASIEPRQSNRPNGWVYLDPKDAKAHPASGVYGWSLFLLTVLFVGPMILLWQDVEIAFGAYDSPSEAWILVVVDAILLLVCWTACRKLGAESKKFYMWFGFAVLIGLCSLAAFISLTLSDVREILPSGAVEETATGLQGLIESVPTIVWWGIILRVAALILSTLYVMQSSRLNVTIGRRVQSNDPFIQRTWSADPGQPVERIRAEPRAPELVPSQQPTSAHAPTTPATSAATVAAVTVAAPVAATIVEANATVRAADAAERAAAAAERVAAVAERRSATATAPVVAAVAADPVAETLVTPPPIVAKPAPVADTNTAPQVDDRRLRARLKQLDDARAAGLISDAEFEARRQALLGAS